MPYIELQPRSPTTKKKKGKKKKRKTKNNVPILRVYSIVRNTAE